MFTDIKIDLDILSFSKININELLTLLKLYATNVHKQLLDYEIRKEDLISLEEKKMIRKVDDIKYVLRELGTKMVSKAIDIEVQTEKKQLVMPEGTIDDLVEEIREKFRGLRVGSMGDKNALKDKLIRWRMDNPKVSSEKILKAVDKYLESQKDFKYLQQADYFVYKKSGSTERSRLSTFIDEIELPSENSDWTTNLS